MYNGRRIQREEKREEEIEGVAAIGGGYRESREMRGRYIGIVGSGGGYRGNGGVVGGGYRGSGGSGRRIQGEWEEVM